MVECNYNNHKCVYCGRCHIEAKKQERCKVDNLPVSMGHCAIPCSNDCNSVKED